jgi:hypothetical protein
VTRKLLLTAAIVALALAPSIGTGAAEAHGFTAADSVGVSIADSVAAFTADSAAAFTVDSAAAFTADSVVFIRAITDMAISPTATTVSDRCRAGIRHEGRRSYCYKGGVHPAEQRR